MRILFVGDVYGKPGLEAIERLLPGLLREYECAFCIVNGENAEHGKGITRQCYRKIKDAGADVVTGGNHTLYRDRFHAMFDEEADLLRPLNLPDGSPGHGSGLFDAGRGQQVAVINLMGRALMPLSDDPFRIGKEMIENFTATTPIVIVDFHAEATAEKLAFARYVDGLATAVIGTHTHVTSADERVLPGGTGFISDVGMTGSHAGVIGMKTESALKRFLYPVGGGKAEQAEGEVELHAVLIEADDATGHTTKLTRITKQLDA